MHGKHFRKFGFVLISCVIIFIYSINYKKKFTIMGTSRFWLIDDYTLENMASMNSDDYLKSFQSWFLKNSCFIYIKKPK